ncbi:MULTISPECIES: LysE family translocator [Caballeronia]|jgi:threonine/homoserine/homoserine lactone efflux protein|uniref:Lysine transporter LysE n=1 Tax=Caballeronia zhejiangensis TaxID=871203 RepID=A0A656QNS4_9BURK|nr:MULTISPECIES: LysE family translocator [Caballeronia]EKS66925.1 lysine exporter protein LysE/YggA [Burkholderia sp. SJ98]KDR30684.1 lysine transporter LysE [Caballeronia zhejiangensis]MDR5789795.1 LysE family translocator [Caballeronia sp. LP003]
MVSAHLLWVFIGALAVVYALPGPDMALVLQTSGTRGFRHGLAVAAGLATARATHVTLSALGVAALLRSAPWLYDGVRIAGGLYLSYVAIQIFRSPAFGLEAASGHTASTLRSAYAKGILSSILNPKALLFCSVLLPQFVRPETGPVWSQVVELGVVLVVVGVAFDLTLAAGAVRISGWLRRHPKAQTVQRWTFSAALLAFAARLSLE